jgi:hypothetical protein
MNESWKKDKKAFDSRDFILLNEYKIISIGAFFPELWRK